MGATRICTRSPSKRIHPERCARRNWNASSAISSLIARIVSRHLRCPRDASLRVHLGRGSRRGRGRARRRAPRRRARRRPGG
ncbi:MAG: hypothetical protein ACK559_05960, partial [bacterium]